MTSARLAPTASPTSTVVNHARPPRPGAFAASRAFAWRGLLKLKHVPEQLGDVIGIPILFTLMFTYLFGRALAGSTGDYLQYLLPGTLVMAVLLVSVYSGVTLNADLAGGTFDRFRSLPVWRPAAIVGGLLGDVGRYLIASGLVVGLGLAIGYRPHGGVAGMLAAVGLVLAFALSLSLIWTCLGLVLRTPSSVQTLGLLVLFPLTFVSNVFVDPHTMPHWLRTVVDANPISHLVTSARGLSDGTASAGEIGWTLAAAGIMTAIFAPLALHLYERER